MSLRNRAQNGPPGGPLSLSASVPKRSKIAWSTPLLSSLSNADVMACAVVVAAVMMASIALAGRPSWSAATAQIAKISFSVSASWRPLSSLNKKSRISRVGPWPANCARLLTRPNHFAEAADAWDAAKPLTAMPSALTTKSSVIQL